MALDATQRTDVRNALGWPERFLNHNDDLEQAMNDIANKPAGEAKIIVLLASIAAVDTEITTNVPSVALAVGVGSLQLRGAYTLSINRSRGRRFVAELSRLLSVPIRDGGKFSTGGYTRGDTGGSNALVYG